MRRKIAQTILAFYVLGAAGILANFLSLPPSEVGNLPMIVWTVPTSIAGLLLVYLPFEIPFPFMPSFLGYYGGHIAFFAPSVLIISIMLWRVFGTNRS